ncbi:MAG: hypothetical protein KDH97_10530 [Calditrichaeota bacterium]|nr:hypothetical protein [Calditrichota bacterium]MCB9089249.1 hypothetical protein [Calditrichia bacterium]
MIRRIPNHASGDQGFTIVEVLIALQLSLLIVSMAYVAYHFSSRLIGNYERKIAVERELNQLSATISRVLSQVRSVRMLTPQEFSAIRSDGRPLRISLEKQVYLNGERLGSGLLRLGNGTISGIGAERDQFTVIPERSGRLGPLPRAIALKLMFYDGKVLYTLNLTVRLIRQPENIVDPRRAPSFFKTPGRF